MAEPPRDADGNVVPYDDPDIRQDDGLIRHVHPEHHVVFDENLGCRRLSTGLFSESSGPRGGMSVDLERLIVEDGLNPLGRLPGPDFGAVRLVAGEMRALGHKVGRNPLPDNPYHGEVWNIARGRAARRRIMDRMVWLKKPTGLD